MALSGWSGGTVDLVIDDTVVDAALTDYPIRMLISAASGQSSEDLTAIFTELGTNKLKIAVENGDTGNECYVEIEKWDNVAEVAELWIKVPSVSDASPTGLKLYFDSGHADNTTYVGDIGSVPGATVWDSDFVFVSHQSQDPSGAAPQITDSTGNSNDGTSYGSMTSGDLVDGAVGDAIDYVTDDYIDLGTGASLFVNGADGMTLSATIYPRANASNTIIGRDSVSDRGYDWRVMSGPKMTLETAGTGNVAANANVTLNAWNNVAVIQSAGSLTHYLAGDVHGTSGITNVPVNTAHTNIGRRPYTGVEQYANAIIDEVRISKTVRSAAWIKADHHSILDTLITYTITPVEANRGDIVIPSIQAGGADGGHGSVSLPGIEVSGIGGGYGGIDVPAVDASGAGAGYGGVEIGIEVSGAGGGYGGIEVPAVDVSGESGGGGGVTLNNVTVYGEGDDVVLLEVTGQLYEISGGFDVITETVLDLTGTIYQIGGGFQIDEIEITGQIYELGGGFGIETAIPIELTGKIYELGGGFDIATDLPVELTGKLYEVSGGFDIITDSPFEITGQIYEVGGGFDIHGEAPQAELTGQIYQISGGFTLGGSGACSGVLAYSPGASC